MRIILEYPYDKYVGYLVPDIDKRMKVILVHKKNRNKRSTVSYARYKMSVLMKRKLKKTEEVDHKDGNKFNDDQSNLQILSKKQNRRKAILETGRTSQMVEMICPACNNTFIKEKRNTFLVKGGMFGTCNNKCKYDVLKMGLSKNDMKQIGEKQIVRFFKRDTLSVSSSVEQFPDKK